MTDDDLRNLFDAMRQENATAHSETRRLFEETVHRFSTENREMENRISAENRETENRISAENREMENRISTDNRETVNRTSAENRETVNRISAENRQYFEVATEDFKHQVGLVAEKVIGLTDELHREAADIRLEMRTGFADTQAMIRFSHAELERRVRALEEKDRAVEETLADVQARLERLEASTH